MASIVWYPSVIPFSRTLSIIVVFAISPIGLTIPFTIRTAIQRISEGVKNFPTISTTLLGLILNRQAIIKNTTENKYLFTDSPKIGNIPIS